MTRLKDFVMANTILIIEDSELGSDLTEMFRLEGFEPVLTPDALLALQLLETQPPALILVDIALPAMSGLEFIRSVRQHPTLACIPIITMAASVNLQGDALNAGANAHLEKPFLFDNLLAAVSRFFPLTQGGSEIYA